MPRLAEDLLAQAHHLALLDASRPKHANLRRAISAAYYALFHFLIAESAGQLVPRGPLLTRVSRAYQHGEMKEVCDQLARVPTPARYIDLLNGPASARLQFVARAFVRLQEQRHLADYDVAFRPSRSETLQLIGLAEQAFTDLDHVAHTAEGHVFLTALAFAKRWERNR